MVMFVGDDNGNATFYPRFRRADETEWHNGDTMVPAAKVRQTMKGSIVHLRPNTTYYIEIVAIDPDGGSFTKKSKATTRNEIFPRGTVTTVKNTSVTLKVEDSGTPSEYRVYQPASGQSAIIDVNKKAKHCVLINANYVIVRGLKLVNAVSHAIVVTKGCKGVVIEDCDISEWGPRLSSGSADYSQGTAIWFNEGENFLGSRLVVQNNKIHHPSTGGKSGKGAYAVSILGTNGNHVVRYNKIYSDDNRYFGGFFSINFHQSSNNCDIYGNDVTHCYRILNLGSFVENFRVWGNSFNGFNRAIIHLTPHPKWDFRGPLYVWRNLFMNAKTPDGKQGDLAWTNGPGRVHFYNNTLLNVTGTSVGPNLGLRADSAENYVVKNNILDCRVPLYSYLKTQPSKNRLNHNLYRQARTALPLAANWEKNGVFGKTPTYVSEGATNYYLKIGSAGVDAGEAIPNFATTFSGSAPDLGACEKGGYVMQVGPRPIKPASIENTRLMIAGTASANSLRYLGRGNIGYRVSATVPVFMGVYDLQGRMVESLVSGRIAAGSHTAIWSNHAVANGVYVCRLKAGSETHAMKIQLAR